MALWLRSWNGGNNSNAGNRVKQIKMLINLSFVKKLGKILLCVPGIVRVWMGILLPISVWEHISLIYGRGWRIWPGVGILSLIKNGLHIWTKKRAWPWRAKALSNNNQNRSSCRPQKPTANPLPRIPTSTPSDNPYRMMMNNPFLTPITMKITTNLKPISWCYQVYPS